MRAVCADRWRSVGGRAGEAASVVWKQWRPESLQMKVEASVPAGRMESVLLTTTQNKQSTQTAENTHSVKLKLLCTYPFAPSTLALFSPVSGDQPCSRVGGVKELMGLIVFCI